MEEQVLIKIEDGIDSSIEKKFERIATLAEKIDKQLLKVKQSASQLSGISTNTNLTKDFKEASINASNLQKVLEKINPDLKIARGLQSDVGVLKKALNEGKLFAEDFISAKEKLETKALKSTSAFKAETQAIQQQTKELEAYNRTRDKSQAGASKTNLKVSRDEYNAQLKADAQAEKNLQQEMNKSAREAVALEKSRESLARRTNSLEGVTYKYQQDLAHLNVLYPEATRGSEQYKASLANIQNEYAMGVNRINAMNKVLGVTGDKTRLARHEMLNLSYQLQDVVVGFASGQRPMTIFIQQGSQIAQVAAASGLGIKGVATAIKDMTVSGLSMIGRLALNPYFLGIATATTILASAYNSLQNELSNNSGIEDMRYQIALAGGDVDTFNAELKKLGGETVTLRDIFSTLFDELDFSPAMTKFGEFEDWLNQRFYNIARAGFAFKEASKSFLATESFDDAIDRGNAAMGEFDKWWQDLNKKFQEPLKARIDLAALKASGKDFDSVEKKYKSTMDSISKSIKDFDREHEQNINNINARWSNLGLGAAETNKDRLADIAKENQRYEEQITQYKEQQANKRNRSDKQEISLANQRASAMQRLLEIESKTGFGVGITSVQKEYSKMKTDVEQDLRKGLISQSDADKAFGQLKVWLNTELPRATVKSIVAFNQLKDPLYSFNENIDWQKESFGLLGDEYDNFNQYQQIYNELLSQGIDLDVSKNKQLDEKIKKTIKATAEDSKLAAAMRAIYDASPTVQLEDNARRQNSLNKLISKGGSDVDYYRNELEKLKLSETGIIAIQQGWGDTFNSIIKPSEDLNQKLKDLNNTLINRPDLSAYIELQKILSKNQETQITFTTAGASDIYGETQGKLDSLTATQKQWDNARKAGLVTENQYSMATRKNITEMDLLRQSMGTSSFGNDLTFGLRNLVTEWKGIHSEMAGISDQFFSSFTSGFSNAIGSAVVKGDSLKESMYSLSQTILTELVGSLTQMGIKYALATAMGQKFTMSSILGIGEVKAASTVATGQTVAENAAITASAAPAAAAEAGATFGVSAIAGAVALGALLAMIPQFMSGFKTGGYTGNYGRNDVAGVVHGQEMVINANATAKNRALLEAINRGANVSPMASNKGTSLTMQTNPVNVTVNNNGSGVNATVDASDPQNIEVMIADAIRKQTPKLVAGQLSNPNSEISTSLGRNTNASRRR